MERYLALYRRVSGTNLVRASPHLRIGPPSLSGKDKIVGVIRHPFHYPDHTGSKNIDVAIKPLESVH